MSKQNKKPAPRFKRELDILNALPRKKGLGRDLTEADLIGLSEAQKISDKSALRNPDLWSDKTAFIKVSVAVELYKSLTDEGRASLLQDEILGGWFVGDGDEENEDDDGEFCSTPCFDDDEECSVKEFAWALDDCSANGILFIW